jgi:hypothetical protein
MFNTKTTRKNTNSVLQTRDNYFQSPTVSNDKINNLFPNDINLDMLQVTKTDKENKNLKGELYNDE